MAYKNFKNSLNVYVEENWSVHKSYKNEVVNLLMIKKSEYYKRNIVDCSRDSKKFYS